MSAAENLRAMLEDKGRLRTLTTGEWYAHDEPLPGHDFNREIVHPGVNEHAPKGAIVIRCDDDFWIVAALPPEFIDTPLPYIVERLWPDIANPTFGPDVEQIERDN